MKSLILGGARSGKSSLAEQRALANKAKTPVYIATAWGAELDDQDPEMRLRIERHKKQRSSRWALVEEQIELAGVLTKYNSDDFVIVVDCLTLWLNNCLHNKQWLAQKDQLLTVLPQLKSDVILVSNEVGTGVVPLGQLSRQFVDEAGWLNQAVAKLCDNVDLVVAGIPLNIKNNS